LFIRRRPFSGDGESVLWISVKLPNKFRKIQTKKREGEMLKRVLLIHLFVGVMVISLGLANNAAAQDIDMEVDYHYEPAVTGKTAVVAGLGLGIVPEFEGSEDFRAIPVPFVSVKFANEMSINWIANTVKADLIPTQPWMAGPILQYIGKRDDVDNSKVDKLDSVDAAFMLGGFGGINIDRLSFSIEVMTDVADGNEGDLVSLRGGYKIPISKEWQSSINVFTTWADEDYMEAYFGIDRKNSRKSGLKRYSADDGFKDVGVSLPVIYSPWKHWSILGVVAYKRLIGDAADSPIVEDEGSENQFYLGATVNYRF
jgi:outer membrane protein